jgi:hypothetical protein
VSGRLIALSGVRSCVGNALDEAAALALGSLGGTGRSLLGVCTADCLVGCDARRRSCVGYALDPAPALGSLSGTGLSLLGVCTADRPVGCDARRRGCDGTNAAEPLTRMRDALGATSQEIYATRHAIRILLRQIWQAQYASVYSCMHAC